MKIRTNDKLYTNTNMRKASKKRKPGIKTKLKKQCDDLWRDIIRAEGKCFICGRSNGALYAHHIIGRINHSTRWDVRNGLCVCFRCHTGGTGSVHNDSQEFMQWYEKTFEENYRYLFWKKRETVKLSIQFYQDTLRRLESEYYSIYPEEWNRKEGK